jgi:hypothetical protein
MGIRASGHQGIRASGIRASGHQGIGASGHWGIGALGHQGFWGALIGFTLFPDFDTRCHFVAAAT